MTHALDWFVITVRPGMEQAASSAVRRIGWTPFLPGYRRTVLKHSRQRGGRGPNAKLPAKEQRLFVSWPGYLWIGAPGWLQRTDGWKELLKLDLVTGVIMGWRLADEARWEAWPLPLHRNWRAREESLRTAEDIAFAAVVQGDAPPVDYAVGQDVTITSDVFFQFRGKCVFLDTERNIAKVVIAMLGGERPVEIPADAAMRHDDSPAIAKPKKPRYAIGDEVDVLEGPFAGFSGPIDAIDGKRLKVTLAIFGRQTSADLDASQVKRSPSAPVDDDARRSSSVSTGRS